MSAQAPAPHAHTPLGLRLSSNRDLVAVSVLALICAAVSATVDLPAVRIPAGLILELALPGYALGALVFARRSLSGAERVLVTVGASLAVTALGGLALDALPGHMGRTGWAVLLGALTLIAALAAVIRPAGIGEGASDLTAGERPGETGEDWLFARWAHAFIRGTQAIANVALALVALALAVAALAVARHAADRAPGFTELSALPSTSGQTQRLAIAVRSHEPHAITFNLAVSEDGRLAGSAHILLRPGELYRRLTGPLGRSTRRVAVVLSYDGSSTPYLHTLYYPHGRR